MKVLFATSEATPFIKTGELADVCGELPICLAKKGIDVGVVLPMYSLISDKYKKEFTFIKHFDIYLGNGKQYAGRKVKLTNKQMWYATKKYADLVEKNKTEKQYIKMGSTFFNEAIMEYVEEE